MTGGGTVLRFRSLAALGPALLVLVGSLLFSLLFLRSTSHWWFEDDPAQYAYVSRISNPLRFFVDPALVRNFGTRASLVPMQLLSSWLDVRLFGLSPAMAYWHGVAALAVTALLMYAMLLRWTGDRRVSASASLLWLLLPSTIAVHSFLSARHYLEGLGWSLAACLFARTLADPARRAGVDWLWAGFLATTVAAMLSKETYAVALPAYLALDALTRRQRSVAIAMAGLVVAYAAYRTWLVSGGHYPGSRPQWERSRHSSKP
jgi:hypothetical protein